MKKRAHPRLRILLLVTAITMASGILPQARGQSPEISMREFSSSQIKKGVRAIGFGGDGATWGNYGLLWHEAGGALGDDGETQFTNGNEFQFQALGMTSPATWHRLTFYAITMVQRGNDIHLKARSPGLGPGSTAITGSGADLGVFGKIAMPLSRGFSLGVLLSHERSHFEASSDTTPANTIRYDSAWRPSGGLALAWEPSRRLLFGIREMVNNDMEYRTDPEGTTHGEIRSTEFRLGADIAPWRGAWLDVGGTSLIRSNAQTATHSHVYQPNLGFEQNLLHKRLSLRSGLDETSPTSGLSLQCRRLKLDTAYVHNMGRSRVGTLFGTSSNSFLATLTFNYSGKHAE